MSKHVRIKFCKATLVYNSVKDLATNTMKDIFTYVWDSHSHTTRFFKNDLYLPPGINIKKLYIQSIAYSDAKIWYSINPVIRNQ